MRKSKGGRYVLRRLKRGKSGRKPQWKEIKWVRPFTYHYRVTLKLKVKGLPIITTCKEVYE